MTDLHKLAVETDTQLAELHTERAKALGLRDRHLSSLHRMTGSQRIGRGQWQRWDRDDEQAIEAAENPDNFSVWEREYGAHALAGYHEANDKAQDLAAQMLALETIRVENGLWQRFFDVPAGHIHASMDCSTCNRGKEPTQFGWLPQLSGLTEAAAVDAHGARLCTVCFPTAPTEWTNHYEAEAAAKKAAQCPGSGTWDYPDKTARIGYVSGNYGICSHCGERVTLTTTRKMRGHKAN